MQTESRYGMLTQIELGCLLLIALYFFQAHLKLKAIFISQPLECWSYRHEPPHPANWGTAMDAREEDAVRGEASLSLPLCRFL